MVKITKEIIVSGRIPMEDVSTSADYDQDVVSTRHVITVRVKTSQIGSYTKINARLRGFPLNMKETA